MRVLVEFFDKEAIDNVIGTCVFKPEIVVFICDQRDASVIKESAVYRLVKRRKLKTRPRFYYVDATDIHEIYRVLHAISKDYPGCVFDFTGGTDLILLVAGAYCASNNLPGYYIDCENKRFIDVQGCGELSAKFFIPEFSAEDVFALTGATVYGYGHFSESELTGQFQQDALLIWDIVGSNPKAWGGFVGWLQANCAHVTSNVLTISGSEHAHGEQQSGAYNSSIASRLYNEGILTRLVERHGLIEITFKSLLLKKSLQNQGIWLELFCYCEALETGYFTDVRTSIVIDWDGVEGGVSTTKNEVDVFMIKGVTPLFISCKMSVPMPIALSEIKILSLKFGGSHSRTVLLTGGILGAEHKALQTRAADLGVHMLDYSVIQKGKLGKELIRIMETNQRTEYFS